MKNLSKALILFLLLSVARSKLRPISRNQLEHGRDSLVVKKRIVLKHKDNSSPGGSHFKHTEPNEDQDGIKTFFNATVGPCGNWNPKEDGVAEILKFLNLTVNQGKSHSVSKGACDFEIMGTLNGKADCLMQRYCFLGRFGRLLLRQDMKHWHSVVTPAMSLENWKDPLEAILLDTVLHGSNCEAFVCQETEEIFPKIASYFDSSPPLETESWSYSGKNAKPSGGKEKSSNEKGRILNRGGNSEGISSIQAGLRENFPDVTDPISYYFTKCSHQIMCNLGNQIREDTDQEGRFPELSKPIDEVHSGSSLIILRIAALHGLDCEIFECPVSTSTQPRDSACECD